MSSTAKSKGWSAYKNDIVGAKMATHPWSQMLPAECKENRRLGRAVSGHGLTDRLKLQLLPLVVKADARNEKKVDR